MDAVITFELQPYAATLFTKFICCYENIHTPSRSRSVGILQFLEGEYKNILCERERARAREREKKREIAPLPGNDGNKSIRLILTETRWKKSAPTLFLGHRSMSQIRLYVSLYNDKLTALISPLTALK